MLVNVYLRKSSVRSDATYLRLDGSLLGAREV